MGKKNINASDSYNLCKTGRKYAYYVYTNQRLNYRWKKKLIRDIFRMWHKTQNEDGIYNEDYWKLTFEDGTLVRSFIMTNVKALPNYMTLKLFETLFEHKKLNSPNNE